MEDRCTGKSAVRARAICGALTTFVDGAVHFKQHFGKRRALGIDYGDRRTGIALSDINWNIATPLTVLDSRRIFNDLLEIIRVNEVGVVIVGLPIALRGDRVGQQLEKVKKFTEALRKKLTTEEVVFWDERLSSAAAHRMLSEASVSLASRKKNVDKIAASFILQGFLDNARFATENSS